MFFLVLEEHAGFIPRTLALNATVLLRMLLIKIVSRQKEIALTFAKFSVSLISFRTGTDETVTNVFAGCVRVAWPGVTREGFWKYGTMKILLQQSLTSSWPCFIGLVVYPRRKPIYVA